MPVTFPVSKTLACAGALLLATLSLVGCTQGFAPTPPPRTDPNTCAPGGVGTTAHGAAPTLARPGWPAAQPLSISPAAVQLAIGAAGVPGGQVGFGTASQATLSQPWTGSWSVEDAPKWVRLSARSGEGALQIVLSADRAVAAPTSADQPRLSGELRIRYSTPDGSDAGVGTIALSADLYSASGGLAGLLGAGVTGAQDISVAGRVGAGRRAAPGQPGAARGVIVKYRSPGALAQAQSLAGSAVRGSVGRTLVLSDQSAADLTRLRADPEVEYVVPNAVLSVQSLPAQALPAQSLSAQALPAPVVPTDQYAPLQWAYPLLGYGAVWRDMQDHPYTKPVTVAVLDTGVRFDHPDLQGALWLPGEGALDVLAQCSGSKANGDGDGPDTDPTDPDTTERRGINSHGTHVTGIIAARWGRFTPACPGCTDSGVVGATYSAPVKILPVRVLDAPGGNGSEADISLAIRYAAGESINLEGRTYTNPHPAQVINLSLGGPISASAARPLCEAVAEATRRGSLVVAAGGNDGLTTPYYPAACDGAVAVAAVSLSGGLPERAYYSQAYDKIVLSAPGGSGRTQYNGKTLDGELFSDEIISTGWNYDTHQPAYLVEAGTSQATPQVSALAALLLSKGVTSDAASTLKRMTDTATHLGIPGRNPEYGYGLINAAAALNAPAVQAPAQLLILRGNQGFRPKLDPYGNFTAYLPDGQFQLLAGADPGASGLPTSPRAETTFSLSESQPSLNLGTLTPKP